MKRVKPVKSVNDRYHGGGIEPLTTDDHWIKCARANNANMSNMILTGECMKHLKILKNWKIIENYEIYENKINNINKLNKYG